MKTDSDSTTITKGGVSQSMMNLNEAVTDIKKCHIEGFQMVDKRSGEPTSPPERPPYPMA